MRTTTFVTLATGLGGVSATFRNAPSFDCPSNTPEVCDTQQEQGFDWSDLADGLFSNYGGFDFTGFECKSDTVGKRDALTGRTFGGKAAWGVAERGAGSSFGCGSSQEVDRFSIAHFDISVEFDTELEFRYGMSDGSTCRHRSKCSKDGNTIKNTQCGGAQNVTIVYPDQESQPSSTCSYGIHTISFSCGTPTATSPPIATETDETSTGIEATATSDVEETSTEAVGTTSEEVSETATAEVPDVTSDIEETSTEIVETSSEVVATTTQITETMVTTFIGTSTVFETSVVTVTSCGPAVVDCPADGSSNTVVVVTQTVAVSTTICPITETQTTVIETTYPVGEIPVETSTEEVETSASEIVETSSNDAIETTTPTATEGDDTTITTATEIEETSTATGESPIETLPCPGVVPSCLNTWLFTIGCSDNTDHSCYCPDAEFVENVFSCIYSHGESDDIVQAAVEFFQGICADHAGDNPAIITGAETVTAIITVTPTPTPSGTVPAGAGGYTTVTVVQTTVVPCVTDGTTVDNSFTTIVVSTDMTVPQVTFETTVEPGATSSDVVLVPGVTDTSVAEPVETFPTGGYTDSTLYTTSVSTPASTGVLPTGTSSVPAQFTGAASPKGVAFGAIAFGFAGAIIGM